MQLGDNVTEISTPFKGPFKGKGQNRKAVRKLELELDELKVEMENLVVRYNSEFPMTPRVVNLRILKRGSRVYPLMYWRESAKSGSFFKLFDSTKGSIILKSIGPRSIEILLGFDSEMIIMNFKSKILGSAIDAYSIYQSHLEKLENHTYSLAVHNI